MTEKKKKPKTKKGPSLSAGVGLLCCPLCGHSWRRHDPEDGKCDAGPPCKCGRDLKWMQARIAEKSRDCLSGKGFTLGEIMERIPVIKDKKFIEYLKTLGRE